MTMTAAQAVESYAGLLDIEKAGTKTTRSRERLLRGLDDATLIEFARLARERGLVYDGQK